MAHVQQYAASITPVANNSIWREQVKKELGNSSLRRNYTINPKTLNVITEPPTRQKNHEQYRRKERYGRPDSHGGDIKSSTDYENLLQQTMNSSHQTPPEKYLWSQTSNQEYGWNLDPLSCYDDDPNYEEDLIDFKKSSCDITRYASHYTACQGNNPFSSTKGTSLDR